MEEKKSIGIKIFGIALIILSIVCLIALPKAIVSCREIYSMFQAVPQYVSFWLGLSIYIIAGILWGFFIYLVTGIGILRLQPQARYLILVLAINTFVGIFWSIWIFGPQMHGLLYYIVWGLILIFTLLFFNRRSIKEKFGVDLKRINLAPKILLSLLLIIIAFRVLSIPLFIGYMKIRYKDLLPVINVRPEKAIYEVKDSEYLMNNCQKQNLFGFRIYLPKDLKIVYIRKGERFLSWNLYFGKMENKDLKVAMFLNSKSLGDEYLLPLARVLKFKNSYEFEKRLNYPNWGPIYLMLKIMGAKDLVRIEEVTTSDWKGFLKIMHSKEKNRWVFDCSVYSLKSKSSAGITLIFEDEEMTTSQAKDIMASLKFEMDKKYDFEFFNQGKMCLSDGNYTSASVNFINALYINSQNPEYAYYLAYSLFGDDSEAGRKTRLRSSRNFLDYALNLDPRYQEAKELLSLVNKKSEVIEKEGSK